MIIRQSTAVVIMLGAFVDKTDGVTPETGLVTAIDHVTTGIFLNKNGGAGAVRNGTPTASVYDAYGNYRVTLNTTDTNTVGHLRVSFAETATCLPVWIDLTVVEEEVYDDILAASAVGYLKPATAGRDLVVDAAGLADANTVKVGATGAGTAQTAGDLAALITTVDDFIDTEVAAIKAKTDLIPASPAAVGSAMTLSDGAITAAKFAAAALVAATFASDYLAAVNAEVDTALATQIPDSYAADAAQPTVNQALLLIQQVLTELTISGSTGTVKKPNGTTTAATLTYNDATNPTSVTRAT